MTVVGRLSGLGTAYVVLSTKVSVSVVTGFTSMNA